jgi:hypothetical protein
MRDERPVQRSDGGGPQSAGDDGGGPQSADDDGGGPQSADDAYERDLRRRQRRFERYLRVRGWLGLVLMGLAPVPLAVAVLFLGQAVGWWSATWLARWTHGFDAVLAVFLPSALALVLVRTGWVFWRRRHPRDDGGGCLVA